VSGTHQYRAKCSWAGSTAVGYDRYDRGHTLTCPPAGAELAMSADLAFRGNPAQLNPEQLFLAAAVSCQLLSFLAVAARARIDVRAYEDHAEAEMPEDHEPVRITAIRLRPHITVAAGTDEEKVHKLVALAHEQCYVANSVTSDLDVRATVEMV
jgi:organic hydroperoxide reductase OsmC/OhrA